MTEGVDTSAESTTLLTLGFYLTIVSLGSYVIKDRLFISSAVVALSVGMILGPAGLDWLSPQEWANHDADTLDKLTFEFTRIVLGIQVLFTGIGLPKGYLRKAWKSLLIVLGPLMIAMWLISSLIIYLCIPGLRWTEAMCIGACVTPTDPVLAASVVKGRFAEKHVPQRVVDLLSAESGANDGLGVPFMSMAMLLIQSTSKGWSTGHVWQKWFLEAILYECFLSVIMGIVIGYVARRTLRAAEERNWIDHESFLAYGFGLTFFCLGVVGVLGGDDLLCAFVAGNVFTEDDWFKEETADHSFQDVIDELLDSSVFIYVGATVPWASLNRDDYDVPSWRLALVVFLILGFRRLPIAWLLHRFIPALKTAREAIFFGWFGPMGVGAIYYLQSALQDLPEERERIRTVITPVIYAIVIASTFVHGCSVPIALLSTSAAGKQKHKRGAKDKLVALDINGEPSEAALHDDDEAMQANAGISNDLEQQGEQPYRDEEDDPGSSRAYIAGDEVVIRDKDGRIHRHPLHR